MTVNKSDVVDLNSVPGSFPCASDRGGRPAIQLHFGDCSVKGLAELNQTIKKLDAGIAHQ